MEKKEFKIFLDSAKKCWDEYGSYEKMIDCLEKKGYKDAAMKVSELTLDENGYILGLTRERIRQILEQALKKIKKNTITNKNLRDFL
jgi:DNA-directed RNA polymerase sigma subunit (sigma70/sigma32)